MPSTVYMKCNLKAWVAVTGEEHLFTVQDPSTLDHTRGQSHQMEEEL